MTSGSETPAAGAGVVRNQSVASPIEAVVFDFSGTLFRLEEDESWFETVTHSDGTPVDGHRAAELMPLGVDRVRTLMVGDSEEADGAARAVGCSFALVDPIATEERPTALLDALASNGIR